MNLAMQFAYPWLLLFLLVLLPLLYFYGRGNSYGKIKFSSTALLSTLPRPFYLGIVKHLLFALRLAAMVLIIIAAARPQQIRGHRLQRTAGLDMMLIIDTSGSMRALDFFAADGQRQSRLAVVKEVLAEFIAARQDDRIGMIVFGDEAYTQAPLTADHDVLQEFLTQVEIGMAGENTAIGDAIGVATNRLKDINAKSKVAILLTDGENTAGRLTPLLAMQAAQSHRVKIYTVGIGSNEPVPVPYRGRIVYQHVPLDAQLLQKIATTTGGRYFHATDSDALQEIYRTIDSLETTVKEHKVYHEYKELYAYLLWPALLLFLLEHLLALTRLRRLP